MEIKALIVDDEPLAQQIIRQYADKIPGLQISAACYDAMSAHTFLQENSVDLLFLDINMPRLSGISFLRTLKNPPLVIFTTAYSDYALEGYELDAIDYLKKPFSFERFCKAWYKAEELIRLKKAAENSTVHSGSEEDFVFIKSDKKSVKVKFSDIYYIEGLGDYIKLHLKDSKLVTNLSMKKIMDLLPDKAFYRIHKSYIVSLDKISAIEGNMTVVKNQKLPIGNSYRQEFLTMIKGFIAE